MNSKVLARIGAWLLVLLFATVSELCAQSYVVIDIGTLSGGSAIAKKINLNGDLVGQSGSLYGPNTRAFVRKGGKLLELGTLPGGDYSSAFDINKRGAVVGDSNTATVIRAFLWDASGGMQDLGTLPGDNASRAFGINDSDQAVGYSSGPRGVTAFVWKKSAGMTSLGRLPGGDASEALDINNVGSVVGDSTIDSGDRHAFLWTSGSGMQDLGTLPGDDASKAHKINDTGDVIGFSVGPKGTRAFLWTSSGGMQNLGTLGGDFSDAFDLNNRGEVIGTSTSAQGAHAFHWSSGTGMQDLNTLIPSTSRVVLTSAIGINNTGLIVAIGVVSADANRPLDSDDPHDHAGQTHAFLLTPLLGASAAKARQLPRNAAEKDRGTAKD